MCTLALDFAPLPWVWKKCLDSSWVAAGGSGLGQEVCLCLAEEARPCLGRRYTRALTSALPKYNAKIPSLGVVSP